MSLRVRRVMGAVVLVVLAAAGCGSGDAPPAPAAPTAAPVVAVPPPAPPTPAPTPPTSDRATTEAPAAPIAPPIRGGDVMWLDSRRDPERPTLLLRLPDRPRPAGRPIAWAQIHHGVMDVRLFGIVPSPYATAEVFGHTGTTCTARVVRARELHTVARPEGDDDPASQREATYLGLELDGCERGEAGIVGTTDVTVHSVRELAEAGGEPAPPALVAVVQEHDDGLGYAQPRAPSDFRVLALPERDLRIVIGTGAWVLAQGMREIDSQSSNGLVDMVIEADWRTFFLVSTPSEGWLSSLEGVAPAVRRSRCVVADPSGTPLNVRRLPRSSAEVVATLANETTLDALVGPSAWARVATTPPGWAHTSGLRCTALPADS